MITSSTSDVTIALKAAPITTATARSRTLALNKKFLSSLIIENLLNETLTALFYQKKYTKSSYLSGNLNKSIIYLEKYSKMIFLFIKY